MLLIPSVVIICVLMVLMLLQEVGVVPMPVFAQRYLMLAITLITLLAWIFTFRNFMRDTGKAIVETDDDDDEAELNDEQWEACNRFDLLTDVYMVIAVVSMALAVFAGTR